MKRNFTLSLFLTVVTLLVGKLTYATNYIWDGSVNTYTLTSGDNLLIPSGTFTGTINSFPSGATITVSDLAVFQPSAFPNTNGNSASGTMYVYGTFTFTSPLITNTGFTMHNYGMVNLGAVTIKGNNQTWTNHYGGTINFSGNVVMNGVTGDDNNVMVNYETINASGDFQMNSGSSFINYKDFNVSGNFKASGGVLDNQGNFVVTGSITMNSGASSITNHCRMEASGGIFISNGNFYNYSYLWARNSDITISSGGVFQNVLIGGATPPIVHGRNYSQSGGAMTGPALLYFYGTTSISAGTVGVLGVTTDTIKMNDITRASPSTIFDNQAANTVRPNVIYNAWGAPDSLRSYLFGCSVEILLEVPLAINWKSFDVLVSKDIPLLLWSAEFDRQTVFEIQRSYDGRNFSTVDEIAAIEGRTDYSYNDRLVNNQSTLVYYRIKAVELGGEVKYTQLKTVRFSHKPGSVYTAPNPFTNNFIINYKAAEKETITIRMFNVSGQQMLAKSVTVNSGNNNINITEAAQLAKGIYVIQVNKGHNLISSSKIIKQ
jgi:Secretion system C-terminal sorting domain